MLLIIKKIGYIFMDKLEMLLLDDGRKMDWQTRGEIVKMEIYLNFGIFECYSCNSGTEMMGERWTDKLEEKWMRWNQIWMCNLWMLGTKVLGVLKWVWNLLLLLMIKNIGMLLLPIRTKRNGFGINYCYLLSRILEWYSILFIKKMKDFV